MSKVLPTRGSRPPGSVANTHPRSVSALLFGFLLCVPAFVSIQSQTVIAAPDSTAATQSLLDKAHSLEVRGRMDMASQTWQQVLLADPRNVEALAGLARAAKLAGNMALSNTYIERLRKIDPDNANIARVQGMMTQQSQSAQLAQAGKLANAGQYPQAMAVYRQVFGNEPPPGDWALAYYETESATDDGRAHAIAGLRALVERYPADSRYQVALGRILTYSPLTRNEGRKLLQKHPGDPQAVDALRQSLVWDSKNPASGADIRAYLMKHSDAQLATALKNQPKIRPGASIPHTPEEIEAAARARAEDIQMQAAYRALNGKHIEEAEQRFKEILADQPDSPRALAGMGYVRMQQSNFGGAISFLEQAEHDGTRDAGIETALASARFFYTMGEGAIALNENDLTNAEKQYQAALNMRPASPEALEGLGGTLLKAQQPQVAVQVYERYLKVKPGAAAAWRGLFMSQYGAGNAPEALATERRIPAGVHAELMKDPDFLRTLASAYSAVGRDADAQRVLRTALDLPFPTDARGVRVETQLQYAGLLQQANRLDQAAGLFRQVLSVDPSNTSAWQGLIRVEHAMKQDAQALQTLEGMPPGSYDLAMRDPGFETTVASVYQAQNKLDIAQSILEKAIAQETSAGQRPSMGVEIQLAGIYLAQNNSRQAYPIYRQILSENPESTDAWKGLLSTLHSSGRDQEVIAQVQQIPTSVRRTLENDVEYLQTIGNVYGTLGQPAQAMVFLNRVQRHYADQNSAPPADIDIQNAYLLFNGSNDTGLYRQLMVLGGRQDLSSEQRRSVQTIWSLWAVRRANQAVAAGNNKRALAILNAAARSFPDNPGVLRALATGYARTGLPKQAVTIFKSQDMTSASASDYKAAVGAALAAGDVKSAETWLRFGLNEYPKDAEMLGLGAKFEQARGDSTRAAEYYRASLAAMPPPDPGAELANELSRPAPVAGMRLPSASQQQDLATLLGPGTVDTMTALGIAPEPAQSTQPAAPYLPAYGNAYGTAPVQLNGGDGSPIAQNYQPQSTGNAVPSYMTNPGYQTQQPAARNRPATLKDYVPQSATEPPGGYTMPLLLPDQGPNQQPVQQSAPSSMPNRSELPTSQPTATSGYQLNEQAYQQQQIRRLTEQAQNSVPPLETDADPLGSGPLSYQPTQPQTSTRPQQQVVYGPYVPYVPPAENSIYTPSPVAVQLGDSTPHPTAPQREVTDVLPTARYVPNSPGKRGGTSQHPDIAAAQAAKARRRQSDPNLGMTGQSNPPAEEIANPVTQNTQYTPDSNLLPQPRTQPVQGRSNTDPQADSQTFNNPGQQYPQPGIRPTTRKRATTPGKRNTSIADQPGLLYPGVAQPLTAQSYPVIGAPQAQGVPPTDAELVARMVPPLRGGYDPSGKLNAPPLTAREATELELNTLESSYSAWIGGTGYARYRSGTAGFDRLTDLEATFEASVVAAKTARFTVIAQPVFLSNGLVDTATQQASTGIIPVLGTLPGNATITPAQQSANGVGGEFQMTTTNLGLAVGYTPYEFPVSNITGRARWRPGGGHFTFFADRSSVKETQLSYAGLRDPGSATAFFPGNIWGGVVSSGGGLRFDKGDEKSGFYLSADGADITGFHVLENRKYEGTAGAYFRVKVVPQIGSLNVGATFFGEHYTHNELGLTYGQGGYFSPQSYFLAAVPISFTGHYLTDWHYAINGSVGVQTFQSSSAPYYPLDRATETGSANATYAATQNTGLNYSVNSEGSYRIADHWYMGAFLTGNNTNNYNTLTGGFFLRYLFKPQFPTEDYPTGLFPLEGFRPLRVP